MVVGNGMLAKTFENYVDDKDIIIFASGVSNSGEEDDNNFLREKKLLEEYILKGGFLVYFSSCDSIYAEKINKKYYHHKLEMEDLIQKQCERYNIFRIPQIIGVSENKRSLISYFIDKVMQDDPFDVWGNAKKNLISTEDVFKIISYTLKNGLKINSIQNIGNKYYYSLAEIIKTIEDILHKKGNYEFLDKGFTPKYDLDFSNEISSNLGINFEENYLMDSIKKIVVE